MICAQRETVDRHVARRCDVSAGRREPRAVGDTPFVEADGGAVDLIGTKTVSHGHAGLLPGPGGEVGAPLLRLLAARTVPRPRVPEGQGFTRLQAGFRPTRDVRFPNEDTAIVISERRSTPLLPLNRFSTSELSRTLSFDLRETAAQLRKCVQFKRPGFCGRDEQHDGDTRSPEQATRPFGHHGELSAGRSSARSSGT